MDLCDVLRFQIQHSMCKNEFKIQQEFFSESSENQLFNESLWLASHAKRIFEKCEIHKIKKVAPLNVILKHNDDKFVIIKNYKLQNLQLLQYINKYENAKTSTLFDEDSYYFLYKSIIDNYFSAFTMNVSQFYVEYGYWNDLNFKIIDPYVLIASNDEFLNTDIDCTDSLSKTMKIFFSKPYEYKYDFDPYVYIASNYTDLSTFVDCAGKINYTRVVKHFIRNPERRFMQFDMWEYLANNVKRIEELMKKTENGKVLWDIHRLTLPNAAEVFVRHKGKCQHSVFKDTEFIKAYIDDFSFVNTDRKLSLENANMYFVKTYVKYEEIRHKFTIWYRILNFLQARVFDSVKQVPFNATRFLIESRCV